MSLVRISPLAGAAGPAGATGPIGTSGMAGAAKALNTSRTATTTLAADPELFMTIGVGTWNIAIDLYVNQDAANAGFTWQCSFSGTASNTGRSNNWTLFDSGGANAVVGQSTTMTVAFGTIGGTIGTQALHISGYFTASASGTFALSWAQNASTAANIVLRRGSTMTAVKTG